eukprot:2039310-Rhodomonas_salina.1
MAGISAPVTAGAVSELNKVKIPLRVKETDSQLQARLRRSKASCLNGSRMTKRVRPFLDFMK